ncbi:MAG: hypothetical protein J6K23_05830 [Bacilli bacterium]|nr:hypothetical protein [Bacilli bacterium]
MKNEILKQIISQIKRYDLSGTFSSVEEFKKWASQLNSTQIKNFLSLDVDLEEVRKFRYLLINSDLLNCLDYTEKVNAISTLKNGDGCYHLYKNLCKPNFLNSENFYKDIEMLSKADTARYGLWIIGEDSFINSPYHDEDLKLLVETHDTRGEEPLDFVVSDAIATVAGNINSIKSPHHRADMKLIATAGSDCLQMSHTYPEQSLNYLAINKVSLEDKYHLENMQILANNPIASEFLYVIMTQPNFVKGKNYRKEVEALVNAKSAMTARALYYYIVNPERKFSYDIDYYNDYNYDIEDAHISDRNSIAGSNDKDYLKYLKKINEIDDRFVMHIVSLLMNPTFINSPYKDFDLELLQSISSKPIFMDLYMLMIDEVSLNNKHHKRDAVMISNTSTKSIRKLLLMLATNKNSLNSVNHEYDMEYITRLELESIDKKLYDEIYYYLFLQQGINSPKHKENLEQLLQGVFVERDTSISSYLDSLEKQLINSKNNEQQIIRSTTSPVSKPKSIILKLFKK